MHCRRGLHRTVLLRPTVNGQHQRQSPRLIVEYNYLPDHQTMNSRLNQSPAQATGTTRRQVCAVFLLALLVKAAIYLFDPHARFFFGDSASYLHAAITDWVPGDRSPTLPIVIGYTAVAARSMTVWIILQSVVGALICASVFWLLGNSLNVRRDLAISAALLLAVEPLQLYYERSLMAEALGTGLLMAMLCCQILYLRQRRWPWLIIAALAGVAAVSMRLSLLPTVLVLSALTPFCLLFAPTFARPSTRTLVIHALIASIATWGSHDLYKRWSGQRMGVEPGYTADEGYFRLGWLAPLVKPEHLDRLGIDGRLLADVPSDTQDRRSREWQIWNEQGLINLVRQHGGEHGPRIADKISKRILREQPVQVLSLAVQTLGDHFDTPYARGRMDNDLGSNPAPATFAERARQALDVDASDWRHLDAPVSRWLQSSRLGLSLGYFALLILAPILLWQAWRETSPALALIAASAVGLTVSYALFGHILVFRYLHPMTPVLLALMAVLIDRLYRWYRQGRSSEMS